MKIAFVYGGFSLGNRPLDFDNLYTAPRGLTGSELSCVEYALAMHDRGHDVSLIIGQPMSAREWRGIKVRQLDKAARIEAEAGDIIYAWNEPNLFQEVKPGGALRVVNQQLNDFAYCHPGWEGWVDLVTSPSQHHLEYLKTCAPMVKVWDVVPNGCNPDQYVDGPREPGRVIWASSADRGLHRLLEMWPRIKQRAPHATLRCFYNFQPAHFDGCEQAGIPGIGPDVLELAQRKRYIMYAMGKYTADHARWGVEHIGSVSRERMRQEFQGAEALAFCADTIRYTEGFSVTTMEACASGCLPLITDVDSLGAIYGGAAPMVPIGGGCTPEFRERFVELVVRALSDREWREERAAVCRMLAEQHRWPLLAERLERLLEGAIAERAKGPLDGKVDSPAAAE